jgi:hypothetical protein
MRNIALITPTLDFELLWIPRSPVPSGAGGCDFAVDPTLRANEAELFWLPDWRASVVILVASPTAAGELVFAPSEWPGLRARRSAVDGEHLILGAGRDEHQLWLPDPPLKGLPLAAVIPIDKATLHRTEATNRFLRHITGRRSLAPPMLDRRVANTVRALDGHLSGTSYRGIAECLFGAARIGAEPWKTSSIRDATIRLVRGGVALMRDGYRKFLRN